MFANFYTNSCTLFFILKLILISTTCDTLQPFFVLVMFLVRSPLCSLGCDSSGNVTFSESQIFGGFFGGTGNINDSCYIQGKLLLLSLILLSVVLRFELSASHLLGRHSTTWTILPSIFVLDIFEIGSHQLFARSGLDPRSQYSWSLPPE
jgi:hypothetical protein